MPDLHDQSIIDSLLLEDSLAYFLLPSQLYINDILSLSDSISPPFPVLKDKLFFIDNIKIELTVHGKKNFLIEDRFTFIDLDKESVPYNKVLIDTLALSDGISNTSGVSQLPTDSLSLSDDVSVTILYTFSQSDTYSFSDAATKALGGTSLLSANSSDLFDLFDSIQLVLTPDGTQVFLGDSLSLIDIVEVSLNSITDSYLKRYLNDIIR